jgi:hypothetical protein
MVEVSPRIFSQVPQTPEDSMRRALLTVGMMVFAMPLAAQQDMGNMKMDHDVKVANGGVLVTGWTARLDRPTMKLADLKFQTMGDAFHATTGPAAIFYAPKAVATGKFDVEATFTQTKAPMHPEAYGILIGGANLDQPNQSYLYFLVRGDGKYMIKHRAGDQVHTIVDWTANDAIAQKDEGGKARNALKIEAGKDEVEFEVNGKEVHRIKRADAMSVDGVVGLRVNHNLDVHIEDFKVNGKGVASKKTKA